METTNLSPLPITLNDIKAAREKIGPYIRRTPLLPFDSLNRKLNKEVLLKCELFQRTGSFKLRGAANCVLGHLAQAKKSGVTAASAGNHAQGVAAICHILGIKATIVMPTLTPQLKVQNTQAWGANVQLVGTIYDESYDHAMRLSQEKGYVFIHPFHDPLIMAGQGTIGLELAEDPLLQDAEAIVIPVGGGGLMTGVATALRELKPKLKIYGVTAKNAPSLYHSYREKKIIVDEVKFTLAEGVAAKKTDEIMLKALTAAADDVFSISEESIAHAIALLAEHGKLVVEGAGALPIAALLENLVPENRVVALISGGNIDPSALSSVLQRGLVEQGRLVRLIITISDRPGGLLSITQVLAEQRANILQVHHQRATLHAGIGEAEVEVDLETRGHEHTEEVILALTKRGFKVKRAA